MEDNIILINKTSENCTPILQKALKKVKINCNNIIRFEKSTYCFYRKGCYHNFFYPSNNMSGEKDVVFSINNVDNLIIDGNHSNFVFFDRIFPFTICNSSNIELKNFNIDFSFLGYCIGTVMQNNENGFAIKVNKQVSKYIIDNGDLIFQCGSDNISSKEKKFFVYDTDDSSVGVCYFFIGNCLDKRDNLAAPIVDVKVNLIDDAMYFEYVGKNKKKYIVGNHLYIGYDESRENDVIFAENSSNIRINNLNIFRGSGMGFIAQVCNNILINNVKICPKTERGDLFSTTADGMMFINCSDLVEIKNSIINSTVDDALNIHGNYSIVSKILNAKTIVVDFAHHSQNGVVPYKAGDIIKISDFNSTEEKRSLKIVEVFYNSDRSSIRLSFKTNISNSIKIGDIIENPFRMPKVVIENNKFINCTSSRVSSSKSILIHNNYYNLKYFNIIIKDLLKYWYESGTVNNVIIQDNTFGEKSMCCIDIDSDRKNNSNKLHKNIVIKNNNFFYSMDKSLKINNVKRLLIENNTFNKNI